VQALSYTASDSATYTTLNLVDGAWHHYFAWVTSTHVTLWVDDVNVIDHAWTITVPDGLSLLTINGLSTSTTWFAGWNGSYAHVAVYDKQPANARLEAHYQAGLTGFADEPSGFHAKRILGYGGWTQSRLIDSGDTGMQGCAYIAGKSVPDALSDVTDTEGGLSSVDGAGTYRFRARSWGYNRAVQWTLGDSAGETPYQGDVTFDFDPTFVNNQILVTRNNGGQGYATDTASQKKYFVRALSRTMFGNADADAVDQANWLLARYKDPHLRVSEVTLNPAANSAVWPVALGVDVGDVVKVTRRPTYAPALSGIFVVEQVSHDISPGKWTVKLVLAPADPYVPMADDATYGVLGSYPLAW
jgi:hypothetical protein